MRNWFGAIGLAASTALLSTAAVAIGGASARQPAQADAAAPTFARDIAPILFANCVSCHRPGEAAPMSLLTYADARPWARAIGLQVESGAMPPWHADAPHGTFANERRLTARDKTTIAEWVAAGAPQGDPAEMPEPPAFADGWRIGVPDAIFEMQEAYAVPASGTIEYQYFYIPTSLTEDSWLQAIEVRPGNRALVHHVLVYYQAPPGGTPAAPAVRGVPEHNRLPRRAIGSRPARRPAGQSRLLATYAPGTDPQVFRPGTALRLPAGSTLELQLHYTANGTAGTDRTQVGMVFADRPPADEIRATQFLNAQFSIPAGAADHRVDTEIAFLQDATVWGVFPHTHVRGTRWHYDLVLPDGTTTPLLSVPAYDFNWQTYYMFAEPLQVPRGARIVSSAWYDNSVRNRANPDPTVDVRWGDQTWEEMQYTGLLYSAR
jgi:mono/diheme cytochrome c family protein